MTPSTRTLYDDWLARRARLAEAGGGEADWRAVELRLLDFLLRRYRDSPEAAQPARFPLGSGLFVNHRAIVVHHHLGRGVIPTVTSRQEANARVRAIVARMHSPAADDATAEDQGVPSWAIPPEDDPVESVRMRLCHSNPTIRVRAAVLLGECGGLDDIGLLSDLLSLPADLDEHPRERAALLHAMQRLSGTSTETFDLTDVLPAPRQGPPGSARENRPPEIRTEFSPYRVMAVLAAAAVAIGAILLILAGME
jgi:hypothetical protein